MEAFIKEAIGSMLPKLGSNFILSRQHSKDNLEEKVIHAAYLGYCELFAEKLSCTPDVDAVIQWFNGLKEKKKGELLNKHLPNMSVSISIMGFGQLPDTDGLLEMITKDLFNGIPDEVLRQFLDIPDIPEEVAAIIKNLLEKEEETIH